MLNEADAEAFPEGDSIELGAKCVSWLTHDEKSLG
jgi:hypothetical protein